MSIEIKSFKSGQRGYKACSGCGELTGVRTAICPKCGFDFKKKIEPVSEPVNRTKLNDKPSHSYNTTPTFLFKRKDPVPDSVLNCTLLTPAGPCPVKLTDFSVEGIEDWARKVLQTLFVSPRHKDISVDALEYWSRYFYNLHANKETAALIKSTLINLTIKEKF